MIQSDPQETEKTSLEVCREIGQITAEPDGLLCTVGLHRWEVKSIRQGEEVFTYNRCARGCRKYWRWILMDISPFWK